MEFQRDAQRTRVSAGLDHSEEVPAEVDERRKPKEAVKPVEVIFTVADGKAVMKPVKRGISDDNYTEITEGAA